MGKYTIEKGILEEKALKLLAKGNPYKKRCTHFYVDMQDRYIMKNGSVKTEEELNLTYMDTAKHDIQSGYADRMAGNYDKWYRYERADEGSAYDLGCQLAMDNPNCSKNVFIIEVNH